MVHICGRLRFIKFPWRNFSYKPCGINVMVTGYKNMDSCGGQAAATAAFFIV